MFRTSMILTDVMREAEALDASSASEMLFGAAQVGEHLEDALSNPIALSMVAERIVTLAGDLGCDRLLGASRLGERLASAAIVTAPDRLALFQAGRPSEHVLVVDGLAATGAQLMAACRRAEADGAKRVSAAAVVILASSREYLRETIGVVSPITPN